MMAGERPRFDPSRATTPTPENVAWLLERAESILIACAGLIDTIKCEWSPSGDWTTYDESVRADITAWLREYTDLAAAPSDGIALGDVEALARVAYEHPAWSHKQPWEKNPWARKAWIECMTDVLAASAPPMDGVRRALETLADLYAGEAPGVIAANALGRLPALGIEAPEGVSPANEGRSDQQGGTNV